MSANQQRLMQVRRPPRGPHTPPCGAQKKTLGGARGPHDATKPEIKAAVELLFKVKVKGVQVSNVKGKEKKTGRIVGRRRNWKKAYVSLAAGQEISFQATE